MGSAADKFIVIATIGVFSQLQIGMVMAQSLLDIPEWAASKLIIIWIGFVFCASSASTATTATAAGS